MPSGRKTRERQLARLAARRAAERKRRRRQRLLAGGLGLFLVLALVAGLSTVFLGGEEPRRARPAASPNQSPSPAAESGPGANCGYKSASGPVGPSGPLPPPEFTIDVDEPLQAVVTTSMGSFTMELLPKEAPCAVNSFVYLARREFFDGLTVHRIVKDFVIQGGDPAGTGQGGPGYSFNDELDNDLKYEVGTVAMANSGPNTNGSQFFVVAGPQGATLDKNYTIFGRVVEGLDVVRRINSVPTKGGSGPDAESPRGKVVIERVRIRAA
ncbi:MAG: peptidylprolyl isomerase [Actinomycetota bacterium]|nr:peptidylprolyl isomerase [Actinomycetota bacterium]